MAGNIFGKVFTISTYGESHGPAIGVVIDGCPAGLTLDLSKIQNELDRRRPGQSRIVTQRKEEDTFEILSGVFEGVTQGTPISILIRNKDQRSKDYGHIKDTFRPSHADYTYHAKYGTRDYRGGGRSSARETAARVAAGAIARQLLETVGVSVQAYVSKVGQLALDKDYTELDLSKTDNNIVRCPDAEMADKMIDLISNIKKKGDTIGGVIEAVAKGVPAGLGEPAFDKLHADLAKAMMSINAAKGFEYGSGFAGTDMLGSEHNDAFEKAGDTVITKTNHSGGIQGGISNGMDINFKVAFKPVATIMSDQDSIDKDGNAAVVKGKGRHDPCVLPRAVPIVEAMAALVLADHLLLNRLAKV
ncbi:MAG: chorismate synthase [Bacteroidetes bacterium]|nr:chorismate synthase [Bacteroidota bacterium]